MVQSGGREAFDMDEEKTLTAEKTKKPTLWDGALKMVKGENTNQLIEQFTAEMTLVAEGLCEDQTKLRREVDGLMTQEDKRIQKLESTINLLETSLEEERKNHDQDVTELRNRVTQLEKQAKVTAKDKKKSRTIIRDLTWLVGIAAAAWVIVTIINAFCK
jgi:predicted RNase H-like nuclease (RuvC/YqgF family)